MGGISMLYRTIAKTGDEVSVLGFGCMRLTGGESRIDEERATRQIRYAIDRGVNYVDTAYPYHMGTCEPFLARALSGGYRERVKLATKLPCWMVGTREEMDRMLASQLERLGTGHIDYYLLHALYDKLWEKMRDADALAFLEKAKEDGRIRSTGFSFHGDLGTFKEIVDAYDWDVCQIQYNYLDERNQAGTEGLEYAAARGLGVVVMEPLRGGNLAGRVPREVQAIWDEAEVKRTPAEWALRWVWNRPEVSVALSGMNEEKQIEENLRVAEEARPGSLTEKELQLVRRVEEAYRGLMVVGCTGCRYCMPCPQGVNIPGCFEMYDKKRVFGDERAQMVYAFRYAGIMGPPAHASLCNECGQCTELCPQRLEIPALLKEVAEEFDRHLAL